MKFYRKLLRKIESQIIPLTLVGMTIAPIEVIAQPFSCEDTPFDANSQASILRSKYHLIQIYGDASYRATNYFVENYAGLTVWSENRLLFPRFSEVTGLEVPLPDPYFIGILKRLKDIDWEDRWDYGVGIEWRPFKNLNLIGHTPLALINHLRLYAAYYRTSYLQFQDEWIWRPDNDFRFGVELYRECNFYNKSSFWSELWSDFSWRETNFYVNEFKSWVFVVVPKWGVNLSSSSGFAILPYLTGEIALTGRREFWQNRTLLGAGIRIMPFRWQTGIFGDIFRGSKFYIEYSKLILYFRDEALENTPSDDLRIGLNYTVNRW